MLTSNLALIFLWQDAYLWHWQRVPFRDPQRLQLLSFDWGPILLLRTESQVEETIILLSSFQQSKHSFQKITKETPHSSTFFFILSFKQNWESFWKHMNYFHIHEAQATLWFVWRYFPSKYSIFCSVKMSLQHIIQMTVWKRRKMHINLKNISWKQFCTLWKNEKLLSSKLFSVKSTL